MPPEIPYAVLALAVVSAVGLAKHLYGGLGYLAGSQWPVASQLISTYGIWFLMSFYLQHVNSITAAETGIILGINAGVTAVISTVAHRLKERPGTGPMIVTGLVLLTPAAHDALVDRLDERRALWEVLP